jgi:gamma-glutamyltranspeptidase/glutathione hydrolase
VVDPLRTSAATGRAREWTVMAEQCTGRGRRGVVNAAAPLAAQAGADALRAGGNAFDAAVAAAFAETVLLPSKCGLGGDLVAVTLAAGASEPEAILAIGGAPAGLAAHAEREPWPDTGPLAVGPPAAAAGYLAVAARGRLDLARLVEPARALALGGAPWAAVNERLTVASLELLRRWNPAGTVYLPDDDPIPAGTLVRLPGLAAALEELVARRGAFLQGPVGAAIVATVERAGGVLTLADLATARADTTACAVGGTAGRRLWVTPAPTHGPSLLEAMAEAAVDDDPARQYARVMRAVRRRREALADPSGTSIVSAADEAGNVVVVVHSNSYPRYGSGLVVADYDLVLANRAGRGFTPEPGHPNFPVAGRRPATTLHAWMMSDRSGRPAWAGGTPGGENQMPWNVQLLQGIIDGETEPGVLVTAPRWEWLPADDGVRIEAGLPAEDALAAAAPRAVRSDRWSLACAQQVVGVPRAGAAITGAADPRTVGLSLGV